MKPYSRHCLFLLVLMTVLSPQGTIAGESTDVNAPVGRMMAILIGVDDYYHGPGLEFPSNDVAMLEETLSSFCGCTEIRVLSQTRSPRHHPDHGKIIGAIDQGLEQANSQGFDTILLFFAGHGLRDEISGELYLAPGDVVPKQLDRTAVPISFVQERLSTCDQIKNKIIVLDTCHAGAQPTGKDIAEKLRGTPGVTLFASCAAGETSIEWSECNHGLYSFWFCVGLGGWADRFDGSNGDGIVDANELHRFTLAMTQRTLDLLAKRLGKKHQQTPELIRSDDDAVLQVSRVYQDPDAEQKLTEATLNARHMLDTIDQPKWAIDILNNALKIAAFDPEIIAWRGKAYLQLFERGQRKVDDLRRAAADFDTAVLLAEVIGNADDASMFRQQRQKLLKRYGF